MQQQTDTILDAILVARKERIRVSKEAVSFANLENAALQRKDVRDFAAALAKPGLQVIAELKKASPSRGLLREDYRAREIASSYQTAGAAAVSILTEPDFFLGSLDDLQAVRQTVALPCLRKDFIVDSYQVVESAAAGADALLLIAAALSDEALEEFTRLAESFRMVALVEVHTEAELDRALAAGAKMIGVNNRDLRTFEVKLETSLRLRKKIPSRCVAVSESGIRSADDLSRLGDAGFDAVLIGEHLMLAVDPGQELAAFMRHVQR
ncbi:MAG: indole-3-glycerol phosphate synthase TrpC [Terriglobia bacterium]